MPLYSDQPECPDYFEYKGKYYLVYSLRGTAHYAVSDQPFEGFKEPAQSVIPCESVPKGALWKAQHEVCTGGPWNPSMKREKGCVWAVYQKLER